MRCLPFARARRGRRAPRTGGRQWGCRTVAWRLAACPRITGGAPARCRRSGDTFDTSPIRAKAGFRTCRMLLPGCRSRPVRRAGPTVGAAFPPEALIACKRVHGRGLARGNRARCLQTGAAARSIPRIFQEKRPGCAKDVQSFSPAPDERAGGCETEGACVRHTWWRKTSTRRRCRMRAPVSRRRVLVSLPPGRIAARVRCNMFHAQAPLRGRGRRRACRRFGRRASRLR